MRTHSPGFKSITFQVNIIQVNKIQVNFVEYIHNIYCFLNQIWLDPFATGDIILCGWWLDHVEDITMHVVERKRFLDILKRFLYTIGIVKYYYEFAFRFGLFVYSLMLTKWLKRTRIFRARKVRPKLMVVIH